MIRFKIHNLLIEIDFLFVGAVSVFLVLDKTGISAIALLSCFIHEMAHMIAFIGVGYTPKKLSFELTGIRLTKPTVELTRIKELIVLVSGSGTNLLIFLLLIKTINQISFLSLFAVTHLLLGIFNMLPLKSFDGGKLLFLILTYFLSDNASYKICTVIDFICILLLLFCSIFMVITTRVSFSLIAITLYLIASTIVKVIKRG